MTSASLDCEHLTVHTSLTVRLRHTGGLAGAGSLLIVYPLDFARTRLAAELGKSSGVLDPLQIMTPGPGVHICDCVCVCCRRSGRCWLPADRVPPGLRAYTPGRRRGQGQGRPRVHRPHRLPGQGLPHRGCRRAVPGLRRVRAGDTFTLPVGCLLQRCLADRTSIFCLCLGSGWGRSVQV